MEGEDEAGAEEEVEVIGMTADGATVAVVPEAGAGIGTEIWIGIGTGDHSIHETDDIRPRDLLDLYRLKKVK